MLMKKLEKLLASESFVNYVHRRNQADITWWEQWIEENPQHEELVERATLVVYSLRFNPGVLDERVTAEQWNKLQARIRKEAYAVNNTTNSGRKQFYRFAAACMGLLALVGAYYLFWYNPKIIYETGIAQKAMLKLPDDSEVTLNRNSAIQFLKSWNKDTVRQVWLQGEAYFKVNREKGADGGYKRFEVHTDQLIIDVVGTAFSVNTFGGDYVSLESGRVDLRLKGMDDVYTLFPGQMAKVNDAGHIEMSELKVGPHISWVDGKITLNDNSLGEVITFIEHSYGLTVHCDEKDLLGRKLSGQMRVDNLDDLLAVLEKVLDLVIVKDHGNVKIFAIK